MEEELPYSYTYKTKKDDKGSVEFLFEIDNNFYQRRMNPCLTSKGNISKKETDKRAAELARGINNKYLKGIITLIPKKDLI